jgi:hypothetical protein
VSADVLARDAELLAEPSHLHESLAGAKSDIFHRAGHVEFRSFCARIEAPHLPAGCAAVKKQLT